MNKMLTAALLGLAAASWAGERAPVAAGRFYPGKPKELAPLVDRQLAAAMSTSLPKDARLIAGLVPHAGLEFSGGVAARLYSQVKKGDFDAVVVVGTAHYKELDGAALYPGAYATPQAVQPYDEKLAAELLAAAPGVVKADASAHRKEHSVEVQLPFIRRALGAVPVVALVMNTQDLEVARQVGAALAKAAKSRRLLLIASSDQSHYPSGGVGDAVDRTTLLALSSVDPAYFWLTNRLLLNRGLPHLAVTYCGEGAVMAVAEAARQLGANHARALAHVNSGDVVSEREYNHVVGYAAVAFTKEAAAAAGPMELSDKEKRQLLASARQALGETAAGRRASAPLSADPKFNLPSAVTLTLRAKGGKAAGSAGSAQAEESLLEAVVAAAGKLVKDAAVAGPEARLELTVAGQTFGE